MNEVVENDAEREAANKLIEGARVCLWGLAVKALKAQGKRKALGVLSAIESGDAYMRFTVELTIDETMIVGQLNNGGDLVTHVIEWISSSSLTVR